MLPQNRTDHKTEHSDLYLIVPPVYFSNVPSLASGLLKAAAINGGLSCKVDYAYMGFNTALGFDYTTKLIGNGSV